MEQTMLLDVETTENTVHTSVPKKKTAYLFFKRFLDIFLSLLALAVLWLPLLVIAVAIRIDSPGPAIFRQKRMGKDGKIFTILKFRTMRTTAPSEVSACAFTDADRYITKIGAFLRRTSIDELPQLWNVLIGDMSIVGYRPLCLTEETVNNRRRELGVFSLRPGITGWAQVNGRDNINDEQKVKLDMHCLLKTVCTVISGEGVL